MTIAYFKTTATAVQRRHFGPCLQYSPAVNGARRMERVDFSPAFATINSKRELRRHSSTKSEALMNMHGLQEGLDHHGALSSPKQKRFNETLRSGLFVSLRKCGTLGFFSGCFVFLFFFSSAVCVSPDAEGAMAASDLIAYQSPFVWRTDGSGDFLLPVIAEKMEYISQPVNVNGVVTSLTASWEATGPVALLVSADAGLHYTPVVNGVPVSSELVKGEALKWKAVLGAETALLEVTLAFATENGIAGTFGEPALSRFLYRKPFKISGSSSGALYNYQLMVRVGESSGSASADIVCDGHILADFNDIRFTSADGETLLPHALIGIEGKKPNRTAAYFVRFPEIPQDGIKAFLYYGNPVAMPLSSPADTFDFYEDFTSLKGSLASEKWSVTLGTGGSAQAAPEGLLLDAAAVSAKTFEFKEGIIEYVAAAQTGYETRLIARDPDPASAMDATLVAYASALDGAQHCLVVDNIVKANTPAPIVAGVYYGYRLTADKNNLLTFERYDANFSKKQAAVSYQDTEGPAKGFVALKTTGVGLGRSLTKFLWIRARKYADPEPRVDVSAAAAEETPALPIFHHIVLDAKKNLVLEASAKSGYYIIPGIKTDYLIRIIVPAWEGQGASVDVSADGGKNYKKDCVNDAYYYVSKGDFSAGQTLRGRINLKKETDAAPYAAYASFSYRPGNIVLLGPNGGDSVTAGSHVITWTAWDYESSYPMKLEYSRDAGKTYQPISERVANTGSYLWTVPQVTTDQALVRISDAFDKTVSDASDGVFFIEKKTAEKKGAAVKGVGGF